MEYADGKAMENMIDEKLAPIHQGIAWIVQAMRDNNAIPNSEKESKKKDG